MQQELFLPLWPQHARHCYSCMVFDFTSLVSGDVWDVANGLIALQKSLLKYRMERSLKSTGLVCNLKDGCKETPV